MEVNPLVSVLMTAYNREKYIAAAIESVLASTYTNFELIIVDDGSVDNTVEIARSFELQDKRIKLYINEENLGDYPNRNRAASYAKGKYLKYLDSDDMIFKDSLMKMVLAIEKYPEASMAMMWVYDDSVQEPILYTPQMSLHEFFIDNLWLMVGPSGCIYNAAIFFKIGGFSGKKYVGDFEFNLKCALKYPIVKMQNSLIFYRSHYQQQCKETGHQQINRIWLYKIQNDVLKNSLCPLKLEDRLYAIKKINRLQSRRVLFYFVKNFNIRESFRMIIASGLGWKNFLKGLISFK